MKLKVSMPKTTYEEKEIEFLDHAIVPGWLSSATCPVCHWGLHEDHTQQYIIAAKTESGLVEFFHDQCFKK